MSGWVERSAPAKLNLALVVGPLRPDGKHEVATVIDRLALADTVAVRRARATRVTGFPDDSLVRAVLEGIARAAGEAVAFEGRIEKRVPVAAGVGGGSSDAAAALLLANEILRAPLSVAALDRLAASIGADIPFFLQTGPQLATGDGTTLRRVELPRDYSVVLALPQGAVKTSTADVYAAFDAREGAAGFEERRAALLAALERIDGREDLRRLPANDLASSPLAAELRAFGALRADVTGAGPAVYGLFADVGDAERAAATIAGAAETWVTRPG